jgi:hypothetical protein
MIFNFNNASSNDNSFWGISYDVWGLIGSIVIPIIIFILGYLITIFIARINRKKSLKEQVDLLTHIGVSKITILDEQINSLNKYLTSLGSLTGTTNEVLAIHQFDYKDLENLNYSEISRSYMYLTLGNKTENFTIINGFQTNIIHTSLLYEFMQKFYNDMYNDLIILKNEWNQSNNEITDIKRKIYNSGGEKDMINFLAHMDNEYPKVENNHAQFY